MPSLAELIATAPLPVARVVELATAVAQRMTILPHGELSPELIVLTDDGVTIAPGDGDRNRYGRYASPERTMNQPITAAADVYSLAVMMFEALTGQSPFRGSSSMELMLAALQEPPRELRSIRAEVPFALSSIITQALAKDAAARPQSGADLLAALQTMDAPRVDAFPGRRLLIVDDDASVRDLLSTIAGRLGVTFDVATNGREAIDAIKARRYTVALLDLNMPRMDGWAVIDFLRRKPADKPSHVFVVTGFADQHMTGVENDVVEKVLYKPINAESLRDVLVRALG